MNERIYRLWDELADFDVARPDDALRHLLAGLCELVDAQNASWVGAVRMLDAAPGDPVHGWRPRSYLWLYQEAPLQASIKTQIRKLEQGSVDESTVRNVALAGSFRVNRIEDLVPGWLETDYCQQYFRATNRADAIWAGVPINEDAESYFGVFRNAAHPRFSKSDCDQIAQALRGLKWFCRRYMLSHGLMVANAPLTPTERDVLGGLLGGHSEKQIAAARMQSPHTTHEYVANIYRKFGVGNRAALMALWLGKTV